MWLYNNELVEKWENRLVRHWYSELIREYNSHTEGKEQK